MQQDTASRVDQESVGKPAKMKVDDGTKQCVDWYVYTSDALKVADGYDRQTTRCHHPFIIERHKSSVSQSLVIEAFVILTGHNEIYDFVRRIYLRVRLV